MAFFFSHSSANWWQHLCFLSFAETKEHQGRYTLILCHKKRRKKCIVPCGDIHGYQIRKFVSLFDLLSWYGKKEEWVGWGTLEHHYWDTSTHTLTICVALCRSKDPVRFKYTTKKWWLLWHRITHVPFQWLPPRSSLCSYDTFDWKDMTILFETSNENKYQK